MSISILRLPHFRLLAPCPRPCRIMQQEPYMSFWYRYSQWDGTQDIPPLDPDDILAGLTDDLMNFGDLQHALRNMMQRGMRNPGMQRMQGLRDLLQQLRQQRRQTLDKYNLSSVFDDLKRQLNEIVQRERGTIDRRLEEAQGGQQGGEPQARASQDGDPSEGGEDGGEADQDG